MERKLTLPIKRHANVVMHPVEPSEWRNEGERYKQRECNDMTTKGVGEREVVVGEMEVA